MVFQLAKFANDTHLIDFPLDLLSATGISRVT